VIRSKNAKPFILTIDILCDDAAAYQRIVDAGVLTPERIADIYHVPAADVHIIPYPAALAVKIAFPRTTPAGSLLDSDLLGAQQAVPLLTLDIPAPEIDAAAADPGHLLDPRST
jgi:hypothetical protein